MEKSKSFDFTVSVIMPCYNAQETVVRALNSLTNQTFKDFEVVAIDDGSTDNSLDSIRKFESQLNIQLLQQRSMIDTVGNQKCPLKRGFLKPLSGIVRIHYMLGVVARSK